MKKTTVAILSVFALTALTLSGAAAYHAQNSFRAKAENAPRETLPATLISPATYEEYLDLENPTDVAVTEYYTAIADGNVIYVYDRQADTYRKYEHNFNQLDPSKNNVTKLQFDEENKLYFLDATYLYVLDPQSLDGESVSVTETKFPCSTFYLHGNTLYYTDSKPAMTQLSKIDLSSSEIDVNNATTLVSDLTGNPTIAVFRDELYYTDGKLLWKMNPDDETHTYIATFPQFTEIFSMYISENVFLCTNHDNAQNVKDFYAYSLPDLVSASNAEKVPPIAKAEGGYSAITAFGEYAYTVHDGSIRQYSLTEETFTDFEICKESASAHRLSDASETVLAGEKLLIADNGNDRISVYDTREKTFNAPIPSALGAIYLAANENTVLAANETQAVLYSLERETYGVKLAEFNGFNGKLAGIAGVYGKYYFATDNYSHYVAQESTDGEWTFAQTERTPKRAANLLTSDAYGYLYVASGTRVYKYSEYEFLSATEEGEEVYEGISTMTEKLLVDYTGSLYALCEGKLQRLGEESAFDLNTPLVYSDTATVQSFAFGIEENVTYLLYAENYLAETPLLNLPTVKTIDVNGADADIFAAESADFTVVKTLPDALVVEFDIHSLQGAEHFPYLDYTRAETPFTALKIGQTPTHNVLAVYDATAKQYDTCLVLSSQCEELPPDEYRKDAELKTGYLTNRISLYKFPYLTKLLTVQTLEAGKEITLLGEIDQLDHPYYQIAYTNENGETVTGYIPKAYVSAFNGAPPTPEKIVFGETADNNDAVWRLVYLSLGAGIICILVDVLILKKKNKED